MIGAVFQKLAMSASFLRIRHKEHPSLLLWVPLAIALIIGGFFWLIGVAPWLIKVSFYRDVFATIALLPGFFIAALAAVATFSSPGLDDPMPEPAPVISVRVRGEVEESALPFRAYLSLLFAYLSLASLVILCAYAISFVASGPLQARLQDWQCLRQILASIGNLIGIFMIAHVVVVTLHGLYFVGYRMHLHNDR